MRQNICSKFADPNIERACYYLRHNWLIHRSNVDVWTFYKQDLIELNDRLNEITGTYLPLQTVYKLVDLMLELEFDAYLELLNYDVPSKLNSMADDLRSACCFSYLNFLILITILIYFCMRRR